MASTPNIPLKIADYYIFPIALPPLPSLPISATHYLYFKPHTPNTPTPESARSLFLVNIPIDSTSAHLKSLFSTQIGLPAGHIRSVSLDGSIHERKIDPTPPPAPRATTSAPKPTQKRKRSRSRNEELPELPELGPDFPPLWDRPLYRSGSTGRIEFADKASMRAALAAAQAVRAESKRVTWGEGVGEDKAPPLGLERYLTHHSLSFPPRDALLANVNAYMEAYNARQEAEAKVRAQKAQGVPDEDGFVTVGRAGRNAGARMEDAKESLARQEERRKEKEKSFEGFYRFQGRERRRERERELVRKFEGDREKVKRMRMKEKGEEGRDLA